MASNDTTSQLPSSKTLARLIFIFGGAQCVAIVAALLRSKVAAITVGAAGVGLSSLYLAISGLMSNIFNLGLPDSGVQTLSKVYADGDAYQINRTIGLLRLWGLITGFAATVFMLVGSPLICRIYFGDPFSHWHSILLLSVVPACTIMMGIETVVLKSLQQVRRLTLSIIGSSILSVVIAVPLYYWMGWDGIIFIIVLSALATDVFTMLLSYRSNSTLPDFSVLKRGFRSFWQESKPMVMLGVTLIITGIGSMSADLLLQSYLTVISSLTIVGFFKAGYQLSITYPAMIFTAVNNDYYPRLSSLGNNVIERNILATKQTLTLLLIVTPCIVGFIIFLPYIIPLMLSEEFDVIVPMVRIGAISVIFRCMSLPVCFMPLALGRKWDFVMIEMISYVALVACVIAGCKMGGLTGIGYGILASNVLDLIVGWSLCRSKYNFQYRLK